MISIHFNENLKMQQCNKILRKKYRIWQWSAFWEGRIVVGSNFITQIYFPALRIVKNILKNTLPHWHPVHISCSAWGHTRIFWRGDMPFFGSVIPDLNYQNTWIVLLSWWWNLINMITWSEKKMLRYNVIWGFP